MRRGGLLASAWLFSLLWACRLASPQVQTDKEVIPVGEYSDMRIEAEHCSGRAVQVWRSGEKLYGLFLACAGLAGDTPTGLLEQTKWDPSSGQFSFIARLTLGSDVLDNGNQVPSKDEFSFEGVLKDSFVEGNLQSIDHAVEGNQTSTIKVHLIKRKSDMKSFASYEQWKAAVDETLKTRGPKS